MKGTPYSIRNNEFYGDMAAWLRAKRRLYQCLRYAL